MKIEVYGIEDCPICEDVEQSLKESGMHFKKLDARQHEVKVMADIAFHDRTTDFDLPVIYIDNDTLITGDDLGGFNGGLKGLISQLKDFNIFKHEYDCHIDTKKFSKLMENKKGNCLCKLKPIKCVPHECAKNDINDNGRCNCRVFLKNK